MSRQLIAELRQADLEGMLYLLGLPHGTKLLGFWIDREHDGDSATVIESALFLKLEHESFAETRSGCRIPRMKLNCERKPVEVERRNRKVG